MGCVCAGPRCQGTFDGLGFTVIDDPKALRFSSPVSLWLRIPVAQQSSSALVH
jgi:hypothetical protein